MTTTDLDLIRRLRERYSPKPAPRCAICGAAMVVGYAGNGHVDWFCDGLAVN